MITRPPTSTLLTVFVGAVWLINGLICKVLEFVPRHREIVARILGESQADLFTLLIGIAECGMAVWVMSRFKPRLCATVQIVVVVAMNVIEFYLVPDLLLFGRFNLFLAVVFAIVVYYNYQLIDDRRS